MGGGAGSVYCSPWNWSSERDNFWKSTRRDRVRVFAKFEIPRRVRGSSLNQEKKARRCRGLALDPCLDSSISRSSNSLALQSFSIKMIKVICWHNHLVCKKAKSCIRSKVYLNCWCVDQRTTLFLVDKGHSAQLWDQDLPSIRVTSSAVFKFVRMHRNFWMIVLGLFEEILIFGRKHVDIAIIFCNFFYLSHFKLKITFVWVFHMSKFLTKLVLKNFKNRFKIHLITDFWHIPIPCFPCTFKIWDDSSKKFFIMLLLQVPTDPCRSYPPLNWQIWRTFQSFKIVKRSSVEGIMR